MYGIKEVGFSDAIGPRIQVNEPNRASRSRRFLNPETLNRVSIVFHPL
jgi:hypothetical protein